MADALSTFVAQAPAHRSVLVRAVSEAARRVPAGAEVLDAGAGDAPYRELFAHCHYRTQDWPSSVHAGAARADIVADLHTLPAELADSFDFVLCTEVLEHVREPSVVLRELRRVLRPGGSLLITVPFVSGLHEEPHDHWRYTPYSLEDLLGAAGFAHVEVVPLGGWYTTLAQLLRFSGVVTVRPGERPSLIARLLVGVQVAAAVLLERLAPRLDHHDARRALPIGWAASAEVPSR